MTEFNHTLLSSLHIILKRHYPDIDTDDALYALAAGLGFIGYENLRNSINNSTSENIIPSCKFNADKFFDLLSIHNTHDLVSREPLTALHDDVTHLMSSWCIEVKGTVDSKEFSRHLKLWSSNSRDNLKLLRELAHSRGYKSIPKFSKTGGYPSSLNWCLFNVLRIKGQPTNVGLRINVIGRQSEDLRWRDFGWAPRASDVPPVVSAVGLLRFFMQGRTPGTSWLIDILHDHNPLPDDFIFIPSMFMDAPDLPYLHFSADKTGIIIRNAELEFKPATETVLTVESLILLGDALADVIYARGLKSEKEVALEWRHMRRKDGLHPCPLNDEYRWDGLCDISFERELATWYAQKLGTTLEEYASLTQYIQAQETNEVDGCHLLQALNFDNFHRVYYRKWDERRSMTFEETKNEIIEYSKGI